MEHTVFNRLQIGQVFLRLSDGHKFIKVPRYLSADTGAEYNALNMDVLNAADAFERFERDESVILAEEYNGS